MEIMDRINELCRQRNITKYRLSQLTGISQSAFSKMEKQQNTLSVDTIHRICNAFGISMAQFFSEPDEYPDLTDDQKHLLENWTLLNEPKREFVTLMLEELTRL